MALRDLDRLSAFGGFFLLGGLVGVVAAVLFMAIPVDHRYPTITVRNDSSQPIESVVLEESGDAKRLHVPLGVGESESIQLPDESSYSVQVTFADGSQLSTSNYLLDDALVRVTDEEIVGD